MNYNMNKEEPYIMEGGLGIDDRGVISFVNDFNFEGVKRFYSVVNHRSGFIRAWHAHRRESKYVTVIQGAAIVAAVRIDNWEAPSKESNVQRYILSSDKPTIVFIPAGHANGFMSLTIDTKLIYFSTSTLEDSKNDDIRYDAHYWDPWEIIER
jgi:dTDP-4-dehydrorhamnose 3,5-epimerase